ncbi:isochorismatase [Streptococcus pyogenes]|nr:putative pyrazinamidase / Nicotinamidase [Streptococcus pyogenes]SQF13035.1 isochorismatase [Streptococcus pyogenes]VHD26838.1 pyrazinamidase / nicotinamidase [Streptococcus pyogenes]
MRALISIDYTNDFVADDGKLSAGKSAQAIATKIAEVTKTAFNQGDYIFLLLIVMIKMILGILRVSYLQHIISKELLDAIFMVH